MSATEIMLILIVIASFAGNVIAIYLLRKKVVKQAEIQTRLSDNYIQIQERLKPIIIERLRRNSTHSRIKKP